MIRSPMLRAVLLGAVLAAIAPRPGARAAVAATPVPGPDAAARREAFLKRAEAAFAAREAKGLEALADVESWRAAGYPEPATLRMLLPPAPIRFQKELTAFESVWRDGAGRTWRLVLREVKGELRAVVRAAPCPRGIVPAPGAGRPERATPKVEEWTLLECWPLPR
jgi:hypothetical protein